MSLPFEIKQIFSYIEIKQNKTRQNKNKPSLSIIKYPLSLFHSQEAFVSACYQLSDNVTSFKIRPFPLGHL